MKTFEFEHAVDRRRCHHRRRRTGGKYYAGGTNLLDLMKGGVEAPPALVDLRRLGLRTITATESGGVLIESGVTNSAIANHPLIRSQYPVLSQAILSRRHNAIAQHGDRRRQPDAAHPLPLLHGDGVHAMQQARSRQRMRRPGRLQPRARHLRGQRGLRRDPPLRHGGRAGHPRRASSTSRAPTARAPSRSRSSSGCPATSRSGTTHCARRTHRRHRTAAVRPSPSTPGISRSATGTATRSRWCRWPPGCTSTTA